MEQRRWSGHRLLPLEGSSSCREPCCLWKVHPPAANQARAYPIRDFIRSLLDCIAGSLIGRSGGEERGQGGDSIDEWVSLLFQKQERNQKEGKRQCEGHRGRGGETMGDEINENCTK
jgi:hypothetical protein